jgi:hypothetical protein
MKELEFRAIGRDEIAAFIRELDQRAEAITNPETKYRFQVKIIDVEFTVDEKKARILGVSLPVETIEEAEQF